ncbi:MAG: ATP-dependent DNA helicase DinG, partial [Candidatus Azotimanducaceae bacterium]
GRTFYLFTSIRAMNLSAQLLKNEYDVTYLVQGSLPKKQLLEKFAQLNRCVLLATNSFWEGVDVRGADLRCLIIDKLPFASPASPLVRAQLRAIEVNGGNGFTDYSLPEAAISLKQGFGRLIREESDHGLFVLGDNRINKHSYGKLLINSLPKMKWITNQAEALSYLEKLEK